MTIAPLNFDNIMFISGSKSSLGTDLSVFENTDLVFYKITSDLHLITQNEINDLMQDLEVYQKKNLNFFLLN